MGFLEFIIANKWAIIFYSVILLILFYKRKKFEIHGIIALYKTKIGLKQMDYFSKKYRELIRLLGIIGIGVSYVFLFVISYYLIYNLFQLIISPQTTSGVSLVIPGLKIPGSPIQVPLIEGWIALFIIVLVHEFSHGIVAKANNLKIKSSGIVFFGPLVGAFVEPDEKEVSKKDDVTQYAVFSAGPFSNILLAVVVMGLFSFLFNPLTSAMTNPAGFSINEVQLNYPAYKAGLQPGEVITAMNHEKVNSTNEFIKKMETIKPNDEIIITTKENQYNITATTHPDKPEKGYIGVMGFKDEFELKNDNVFTKVIYSVLVWIKKVFKWIFVLSLGIGLINLLPLGPTDGGRILKLTLEKLVKDKKKSFRIWSGISIFFLAVLILNFFYPMISFLFN